MKVVIIGAGAMGSIYGGFLAEAGNEVYFLDVFQKHIDTINNDGLWIEGTSGDRYIKNITATSDPLEVGVVDLAIVFVKSTITDLAMESNKAVIGKETVVLTLQNGLGNIEKIRTVVEEKQIISGTTSHGANLLGPGRVKHAGSGATVIGELNGEITDRIQKIAEVFRNAKLEPVAVSDNVMGLIWDKLLINVAINPLTAITGLKNGQIFEYPEFEKLAEEAVREAIMVAENSGVKLETDAITHFKEISRLTGENVSSMLSDITNKRKTEIENINGAIVREGKVYNIKTPVNELLTRLIKLKEQQY